MRRPVILMPYQGLRHCRARSSPGAAQGRAKPAFQGTTIIDPLPMLPQNKHWTAVATTHHRTIARIGYLFICKFASIEGK